MSGGCAACKAPLVLTRGTLSIQLFGVPAGTLEQKPYSEAWFFCSEVCRMRGRIAMNRLIADNRARGVQWTRWQIREGS